MINTSRKKKTSTGLYKYILKETDISCLSFHSFKMIFELTAMLLRLRVQVIGLSKRRKVALPFYPRVRLMPVNFDSLDVLSGAHFQRRSRRYLPTVHHSFTPLYSAACSD